MQTQLKNLFSLIKRDSLFCLQGHKPVAFVKITLSEWNTEVLMAGSADFATGSIHQQDVSRSKALEMECWSLPNLVSSYLFYINTLCSLKFLLIFYMSQIPLLSPTKGYFSKVKCKLINSNKVNSYRDISFLFYLFFPSPPIPSICSSIFTSLYSPPTIMPLLKMFMSSLSFMLINPY